MTKKSRNILFLILLVLFLTAAPITVFYSLGWRFDWQTKRVIQPGVFYFKVWPKNVQIYLTPLDSKNLTGRDGKSKKKTDFFFGSALIENLSPGKYEAGIQKEGFHTWKKNLEIKEREITEIKNIVLIPENPKFKTLTNKVKGLFFSPDGEKIILRETNEKGWGLKFFEVEKNLKSHLIEEGDISRLGAELMNLEFSSDSKRALLEVGTKERLMFYLLDLDKTPPILTGLDFLGLEAEKVYFSPKNGEKLLVLGAGKLTEAALTDKTIYPSPLENIVVISISKDNIFYLDKTGFVFKTDFSFSAKDKLNIIPLPLKKETEYKIVVSGSKITLKENDILYIFDENKKSFEKVSDSIKGFEFSSDAKKLAYFNNYEIWILFLEKIIEVPQKEAGEKLFLTRFSEEIGNVFWFTNHYLIFNVGDKIKVAEIDDRDRINIVDLAEFKSPEIFWANKKLYVLSEENLYPVRDSEGIRGIQSEQISNGVYVSEELIP